MKPRNRRQYLIRARNVLGIVALALAVATSSATAQEQGEGNGGEPSVGELIRAFESVVFGTEFQEFEDLTGRRRVWKWETPLRVVVRNFRDAYVNVSGGGQRAVLEQIAVSEKQIDLVRKHLTALVAITGLRTEDARVSGAEGNFFINFVPRHQMANPVLADLDSRLMRRMAAQGGCYFALWPTPENGRIHRAVVVINAERNDGGLDHCVLEEMTQSLGLPNDVRVRWPSVFSDDDKVTTLAAFDCLFLKTLYDPRIKAGVPKAEGLRMARRILAEQVHSPNQAD